jgi:hypothetical protein
VLASGDSGLAFQDSITTIKGDTVRPPADTLNTPGTIQGIIQMQPGDDPRTVFILFMGTHTFTMPGDDAGHFTSDNMAAGNYSVRILTTTPNYRVKDTSLSVVAGTQNVLPGPIVLQYTGIPIPQGLRINYDTLKQIVNLIWNKPANGRTVQSYTVYRKHSDSASFVSIKAGVTDTTYSDSAGVQDQTYEYRVAVVDTQNTTGVMSQGDSVTLVAAFNLTKIIGTHQVIDPGKYGLLISSDTLFSAERVNNIIELIDTTGTLLGYLDTSGATLQGPYDIAKIGDEILVTDNTSEIKIFGSSGAYSRSIVLTGAKARCIAVHNPDSIYIGDADSSKIYLIGSTGTKLDSTNYNFNSIRDILVSNGLVVVSDSRNRRLVYFTMALQLSNEVLVEPKPTTPLPGGGNRTNQISAIADDGTGRISVGVSVESGKVYLVEQNIGVVGKFTLYEEPGDFNRAMGIVVQSNGLVYISATNGTILVYSRR